MAIEPSSLQVTDLLDAIPDGLLVVDSDGAIVLANQHLHDLFAYPPGDLVGRQIEELVPTDRRGGHVAHRTGFAAAPRVRAMGVAQQLSGQRLDGSQFPVEVALSPVKLPGGAPGTIATVRDMTERLEASAALATAQRQTALLGDRERVARDLHDTVIQELFATGMHLQATLPLISDASGAARVSEAVDAIDNTIKHVRTTIFGLRDPLAGQLKNQLEEVVRSFDDLLEAPATLTLVGDLDHIGIDITDHLVPTLREALTNVVKHAGARNTAVVISRVGQTLRLEVHDDGVGVESDATDNGDGVGNLSNRAAELRGDFRLESSAGGGSVLMWSVPLS